MLIVPVYRKHWEVSTGFCRKAPAALFFFPITRSKKLPEHAQVFRERDGTCALWQYRLLWQHRVFRLLGELAGSFLSRIGGGARVHNGRLPSLRISSPGLLIIRRRPDAWVVPSGQYAVRVKGTHRPLVIRVAGQGLPLLRQGGIGDVVLIMEGTGALALQVGLVGVAVLRQDVGPRLAQDAARRPRSD